MPWLAVAFGGSVGAMARYGIYILYTPTPHKFPFATLLINLVGSLLIGVFYVVLTQKGFVPPIWRQLITIGFLGGFTTFSTFSIESLQLVQAGNWYGAASYIAISCIGGIFAVVLGVSLAEKIA